MRRQNRVRFLSAPGAEFHRFCPIGAHSARNVNSVLTASQASNCRKRLEARVGIEPTHKGFADLSLTTWVPRPCPTLAFRAEKVHFCRELAGLKAKIWSGRRGSNPRHRPWQGRALPLSYSRSIFQFYSTSASDDNSHGLAVELDPPHRAINRMSSRFVFKMLGDLKCGPGLRELHFDLLCRPVELHDAEAADLPRAGGLCLRSRAGAALPPRLQHRTE